MRNGTGGSFIRNLGLGLVALLATACGGGGGGGGGGFLPDDGSGDTVAYDLTLELFDASGNPSSVVTSSQPITLRVRVLESTPPNDPVTSQVVAATTGFGVVEPENGQALTNDEGIAEFTIRAGDTLGADTIDVSVESPSGTITSSVSYDIQPGGLQLGSYRGAEFAPGLLSLNATSIAANGTALVRFAVTDEFGEQVSSEELVQFESACTLTGDAALRLVGTTEEFARLTAATVDGLGSVEYVAGTCEGEDTIEGTLQANGATASATVSIAPAQANFIGYFSSNPVEGSQGEAGGETQFAGEDRTILPPRGTGGPGQPEVATITFEVLQEAVPRASGDPGPGDPAYLDNPDRRPLTGVTVNFSLTNTLGGITLLNDSGVTDGSGLVEVEVQAGNVPTSSRVTATFEREDGTGDLSTTSNQIVIGSGLPDQNSVSLVAEVLHLTPAGNTDGVETLVTVRLADRFNNPVVDGTAARFVSEYGAIDESCITGVRNGDRAIERGDAQPGRGSCSVLWVSQAPRFPIFNNNLIKRTNGGSETINDAGATVEWVYDCPSHNGTSGPCPDDLGAIRGLRSTVLVTVVGEESFVDANGNGLYDEGEDFENLPEPFLDHNEDGVYTPDRGPQCGAPSSTGDCEAAGAEEEFIDANGDGLYSLNNQNGGGTYNGILCPVEGDGVFCSRELVTVRDDIVITLALSAVNHQALLVDTQFSPPRVQNEAVEGESMLIHIADVYNNGPGTGSEVTLEATDDCELITPESFIVPERSGARGAYSIPLAVSGPGSESTTSLVPTGRVNVSLADPEGDAVRIASYTCSTRCDDPTFETNDNGTPDDTSDDFQEQTGCDE